MIVKQLYLESHECCAVKNLDLIVLLFFFRSMFASTEGSPIFYEVVGAGGIWVGGGGGCMPNKMAFKGGHPKK